MVQEFGNSLTGVYNVSVTGTDITPVWCDMETDGGGWTVFQRRIDGATDFYRGWTEYRDGFGDVNHEFWLGKVSIISTSSHTLTSHCDTELRIDMEDFENNTAYAKYSRFNIGNASDAYRLNVSGYSGNAGDSLTKVHNGQRFTTKDNDPTPDHCSVLFKGAWWYSSCHACHSSSNCDSLIKIHNGHLFTTKDNDQTAISCSLRFKGAWWYNRCHESNLNGLYLSGPTTIYAQGVVWFTWKSHYYSLKDTKMMFRRVTKT
ncbi:microfibril-associated glycoprotein 4-like [Pecten maximus]|uniref:microfibril-associated glycoprotein 4-like n=1 Tax=Pecten maximus TaxID=6579 RepID=UPI001457FE75|nr:microfibril-associated glycoprotein 4-like [Pecten maximus]